MIESTVLRGPCQYLYDLLIGLATAPENQQILACISSVREEEREREKILFVLVSRLASAGTGTIPDLVRSVGNMIV